MKENFGENINRKLRGFNRWFDAFILEAAKPLAILGFTMGTVDIYTRGGLATQPFFAVPWSVVQALTIDGLFFAVWWRFFGAIWTKKTWPANIGLLLIGLVLSGVATLTNMILGFQQLWGVSDSQMAMSRLGIDPVAFTVTRAVLVVAVTVMVSFTYFKSHSTTMDNVPKAASAHQAVVTSSSHSEVVTTITQERQLSDANGQLIDTSANAYGQLTTTYGQLADTSGQLAALPKQALSNTSGQLTIERDNAYGQLATAYGQLATPERDMSTTNGQLTDSDMDMSNGSGQLTEIDRETVRTMIVQDRTMNLAKVSRETGVSYSTLKSWRRKDTRANVVVTEEVEDA